MALTIKGKVHEIGSVISVTESFRKRELIILYSENPNYPEYVKLELQGDKVDIADALSIGDEIEVYFNLRGRPWTNKDGVTSYFNTLVVWKFEKITQSKTQSNTSYQAPKLQESSDDDDLPF